MSRFSWGTVPSVPAVRDAHFVLPGVLRGRLPSALTRRIEDAASRVFRSPHEHIEEIRMRAGACGCFTVGGRNVPFDLFAGPDELTGVLLCLCRGSLYAYEQEIRRGFLSLPDGIRVGVAGEAAAEDGRLLGVRTVTSLCIRLPHVHPDVGGGLARLVRGGIAAGSPAGVLIYGAPGVGKTTLLRSAASLLASPPQPLRTVIVDTRRELGFGSSDGGSGPDVLSGYPRALGLEIAVRTLNAQIIVCDEIGGEDEIRALIAANRGGVPLLCSAHAGDLGELLGRPGIRALHEAGLFSHDVGITRNGRGGFVCRVTGWPPDGDGAQAPFRTDNLQRRLEAWGSS